MNVIDINHVINKADSERAHRDRVRNFKDRLFALIMGVGGVSVIGAILLIFFYLLFVILPLFGSASIEKGYVFEPPREQKSLLVDIDEYAEIALNIYQDGIVMFSSLLDEKPIKSEQFLSFQDSAESIRAISRGDPASRIYTAGTSGGRAVLFRAEYELTYPNDRRVVIPSIEYPLGRDPILLDLARKEVRLITGQFAEGAGAIASVSEDGRLSITSLSFESSFLGDDVEVLVETFQINDTSSDLTLIALDVEQRDLVTVSETGILSLYDVSDASRSILVDRVSVVAPND